MMCNCIFWVPIPNSPLLANIVLCIQKISEQKLLIVCRRLYDIINSFTREQFNFSFSQPLFFSYHQFVDKYLKILICETVPNIYNLRKYETDFFLLI